MTTVQKNNKTSDYIIDGLIFGFAAGFAMGVYLVLAGLATGTGVSETLSFFSPFRPDGNAFLGAFSHLAVSGIYGALFGAIGSVVRDRIAFPKWAAGLGFGLILLLVANYALLPGSGSQLVALSRFHFGVSHLVYGLALGWLMGRKERT